MAEPQNPVADTGLSAPSVSEATDIEVKTENPVQAGPPAAENTEPKNTGKPLTTTSIADVAPAADTTITTEIDGESSSSRPLKKRKVNEEDLEPLEEIFHRRTSTIKEGDNVLLRLPSDAVKAVVASKDGLVQLGKYGAFPSSQLLGLHYDITYEISRPSGDETPEEGRSTPVPPENVASGSGPRAFGQSLSKKNKKKQKGAGDAPQPGGRSNPGWKNVLRPLKRRPLVDAVVDDIQETNEFIDDETVRPDLLSHEEIAELRSQGVTADEMMKKQIERHEKFGLKTDFSKEKWRIRKEKKFSQTVHPLAPSLPNITTHYATRSPNSILHLREDTLSQLLTMANIRPDGRYLVVDDTGGLVTAALLDKMGCEGRILSFTENDGPPPWGVLQVMNWSERELACVKWLNWMEADESYQRPPPPDEDGLPAIATSKTQQRLRRHNAQVAELNAVRDDLHSGNWDGLVLATELSPISVLARLTPYVIGSGSITVYSPYLQVLAETLAWARKDSNYLAEAITESWTRTYQVLPGRTHPMMTTSATGGYLFNAIRVFPSSFEPSSHQRSRRRNGKQAKGKKEETPVTAKDENGAVVPTKEGDVVEDDAAEVEAEVDAGGEMEVDAVETVEAS